MSFMHTTRTNHVYIVEDSAPIRQRVAEMLGRLDDVKVVGEAANAREAIAGIRRTQPDSVLLDLNLMGPSGFEVLKAIGPERPEVVFVVLTGHTDAQYERACRSHGASYFLDKLTDFERVPEVLSEIARQP
jgi:DNA-binding NarL/FixJ family response regulator